MAAVLVEVINKEAGLLRLCLVFGALGASGLLLGRWRRWLSLAPLVISAFLAWSLYGEVNDAYVGFGVVTEAGRQYVMLSYVAMAFGIALPVIGFVIGRHPARRVPTTNDQRPTIRHG